MPSDAQAAVSKPPVDFLWLELTNQCNLQCTHCYADSGPRGEKSILSAARYLELMTEAFNLGCRRVQFIGGEPTLNRDLPMLIHAASGMGFEFIEVFTNLTRLSEELLQCFVENRVYIATSVFAPAADCHDAITQVKGSFEKTITNLRRVVKAGLPVRAGIVEMESNAGQTGAAIAFLRQLGVQNVNAGRLRHFGRGAAACEANDMSELCGNCAGGTLCVSPTGKVSPCIMSKQWSVGSILESSLSEVATGNALRETRERIYQAVVDKPIQASCPPSLSNRHAGCVPSYSAVANPAVSATCPPTVGDRQACPPAYDVLADATISATCPPTVGDRQACVPAYDVLADTTISATCPPTVGDRQACVPAYDVLADTTVSATCSPGVTGRDAVCPPSYEVVDRAAPASCSPGVNDWGPICPPSFVMVESLTRAKNSPSVSDRHAACPPFYEGPEMG
jgi:MoaA/NifB/PqqE/SkfB family radical SAM enzyme